MDLVNCYRQLGFIEGLPEDIEFQLEELNLYNTGATAEQVSAIIQRCPRLKKLNLWQCPGTAGFIEGLPEGFGAQLEELNLSDTGATVDKVRAIVQRCRKLKKLKLGGCKGGAGPIAELSAEFGLLLEELDLEGTRATAEQVSGIVQRCSRVKTLNLYNCRGAAGFIEGLPADVKLQLEELNLSDTDATADQVRAMVQQCPKLRKLNLIRCPGAAGFAEGLRVVDGQALEELNLMETDATADQVRAIVQQYQKLKKLDLRECRRAVEFAEGLPVADGQALEELSLSDTDATARQVRAIVQRCPKLKKLDLEWCLEAARFAEGLPADVKLQLEELNLSDTDATARQVRAIVQRCPKLKELCLSGCGRVARFAEGLPVASMLQLEELHLSDTDATADQVRAMVQQCPKLRKLNLEECQGAAGFAEGLAAEAGQALEELNLFLTGATAGQIAAIRSRFPLCKIFHE